MPGDAMKDDGDPQIPASGPAAPSNEPHEPLSYSGIPGGNRYYGAHGETSQPGDEGSIPGNLSFKRMFHLALRKWTTIALMTTLGAVVAWTYLQYTAPTYRAVAMIELSLRKPRIMNQANAVIEDVRISDAEDILNTRLAKIRSPSMVKSVIAQMRAHYPQLGMDDELLEAIVLNRVDINLQRRSRLVTIAVESERAAAAADIANAYAQAAEASVFDENRIASESAVAWLKAQAEQQRKVVEKADQAILDFRTRRQVDTLASQKKIVEASLVEFNQALVLVQSEEAKSRELLKTLENLAIVGETPGAMPDAMPRASEIADARTRLQAALAQKSVLLARYTEHHPEVVAQDKVIADLREQFGAVIGRAKETAAANLALLNKQSASLDAKKQEQAAQNTTLEIKINETRMQMDQLERERSANELSYRGILNRIEEARLAADETTTAIKIVEQARFPRRPVRPQPSRVIALGSMLGLLAGAGLVLLTFVLEDQIVSADDIEKHLVLKVLALVPDVKHMRREQLALASEHDAFGQMAEAFAGLRGLLESPQYREHSNVILIASSFPEEGKTITACNLALTYAASGARTLLVDFDLRRPRIGRIFKAPPEALNLMHALCDGEGAEFDRLPIHASQANLDLVVSRASGTISSASVMSLGSVPAFVAWASRHYDRVIIDSPPLGVVSDSIVLGNLAGCVILVCRPSKSRISSTRAAMRQFNETGGRLIGIVVNDVDFSRSAWFSNYDYRHYGRDYHYNYAAAAAEEERKTSNKPQQEKPETG